MIAGSTPPQITLDDQVVVAALPEEIDLANARGIGSIVAAAVPNDAVAVVLDLSGTSYLDSSGVHLIFDLADRLLARQQRLVLAVPETSHVRRVLELVDVGVVAPMEADLVAAKRRARG
ncbi:MAG: STAS domain-containing protein [Actinomycetota bacterium]|nr:STAS domain-containing protein [Actinomycetota bacterium]